MPAAETAKLIAELTLKDNLSKGVRSATGSLGKLDKATSRTQKSLGTLGSNLSKGVVIGAAAAAGGFVAVINSARDFESAFAGVRKTVNATPAEFDALSDSIRKMAKEIPISAAELAVLGETAGALGIEGTANIQEFIRVTALLGVTTDLTADAAANSLGVIANVLHLTSGEYSAFASSLVALGNAGASTESQIIEIAQRAGAAGELIGLSTEQVLGFSSAIASLGIETEAGGSALQNFLINTAKFAAEGGEELKLLAKISGTSAKQFKKNFDKDAGAALQRFLANLGKLSQGEQLAALEGLGFNDIRITRTLLGLANNTALVADQMDVASDAFKENTALTKEAEQRFATFDSQLQITKNVLNDIGITIGSKLLPKLTPLLQKLNAFVTENQGKIEEFGTRLADGFDEFATAIGKVDWTPFIDGFKISADIAKTAVGLFMSLPPDVQKIAIAALAVNKVTGGLGSSIIKDLAGLALSGLKTITAANVTVIGANVTGGPGGIPPVVPPGTPPVTPGGQVFTPRIGAGISLDKTEVKAFIVEGLAELQRRHPDQNIQPADIGDTFKRVLGGPIKTLTDNAKLQVAASERLESTTGSLPTETAKLINVATERAEANQTATLAQRLAEGTTRSEAAQIRSATAVISKASADSASERSAIARAETASRAAGQAAASAIKDKDMSLTVNTTVNTSVSIRDQIRATKTQNRIGAQAV